MYKPNGSACDVGWFRVDKVFYEMLLYISDNDQMVLYRTDHDTHEREMVLEVSADSYLTLIKDGKLKSQIGMFRMYGDDYRWKFAFFPGETQEAEEILLDERDVFRAEAKLIKILIERGII